MVVIKEVMSVNQVNDGGILKYLLKGFLRILKTQQYPPEIKLLNVITQLFTICCTQVFSSPWSLSLT